MSLLECIKFFKCLAGLGWAGGLFDCVVGSLMLLAAGRRYFAQTDVLGLPFPKMGTRSASDALKFTCQVQDLGSGGDLCRQSFIRGQIATVNEGPR